MIDPLTKSIPNDVAAIMRRLRMSKRELAAKLNVSEPRLSQMFSTDRNWTLKTVEKVFAALDCELHHFVVIKTSETKHD